MGRKRRIHIPGGICHITQQCHSRSYAFANDNIKKAYLELAYQIAEKDQVEIICFCIQDSHPHWVLKMPQDQEYTISQFMHKLNSRFGRWFNKTFGRKGTFWAGRFSCTWLELGSTEFFQLTRYVDRNPLERKTNRIKPEDYKWGSFHYLFKSDAPYPVTFLRYLLQAHPDKTEEQAFQWYQELVKEDDLDSKKRQSFFSQLLSFPFLGSESFEQKGREIYRLSLKRLQTRGISWIKLVRDYSRLFLPMARLAYT